MSKDYFALSSLSRFGSRILIKFRVFEGLCFLLLRLDSLVEKLFASTREYFLDILTSASTSLKTLVNALALGEFYRPFKHHLSLRLKLALVSYKIYSDILGGMLFNFLQPSPQIVKGLISGDIIGEEHAVCSPVEYPSHRFE